MPLLRNNESTPVKGGTYIAVATITTGTMTLQLSYDNATFTDITDAEWSTTTTAAVLLPKCWVRAVPSGTSTLDLTIIEKKR